MSRYVLLMAPSANRVYAQSALGLTEAELEIFARAVLSVPVDQISRCELGGVDSIELRTAAPLSGTDLAMLGNLSSGYVLFEVVGELLRPVSLRGLSRLDEDLITIPKYAGKTNEQFTRLLLNVTLLASASASRLLDGGLTVLDPLCGRGTTLSVALRYGYHAIGIERDGKEVDAYAAFIKEYLRRKRIKHSADLTPVRVAKKLVARRFQARIGEGAHALSLTAFHADTRDARQFLRAGVADVIVADAPYGVAHASQGDAGRARGLMDLMRAAVPVWARLLRSGGALGLSWNTHLASRAELAGVLTEAGLAVVDTAGYERLAHRVDQAIDRDVLVARSHPA